MLCRGSTEPSHIELDPVCRQVLRNNITKGRLDDAPIFEDVTTLTKAQITTLKP
jgi:hypothetical protein